MYTCINIIMKAVIYAGGKAVRLMPSYARLPKALMPVGNLTVIEVLLHQLQAAGVSEVILCTGRHAALIEAVVLGRPSLRMKIALHRSGKEPSAGEAGLGSLAPLKTLAASLPDRFLLLGAGVQCTLDFKGFFERAVDTDATLAIAVHKERYRIRFGVCNFDSHCMLTNVVEKPMVEHWVNMGLYVVHKRALGRVPESRPFGMDDLIPSLLTEGERVRVFPFGGIWMDVGRSDDRQSRRVKLEAKAKFDFGGSDVAATVADLSLHGMLLLVEEPIEVGTEIEIEWTLPGQYDPIRALGVVTRTSDTAVSGTSVDLGVRFIRLGAHELEAIERFIGDYADHRAYETMDTGRFPRR